MQGSTARRAARLATHLIAHPGEIGRYFKYRSVKPIEFGLPWISWPAIDFLKANLKLDQHYVEFGSGGSTLFCAPRVASVISIENDKEFVDWVSSQLALANITNVEFRVHPIDEARPDAFASSDFVNALDAPADVILIDGLEDHETDARRPACFEHAERFIRPGGFIVLDDAWRYDHIMGKTRAKSVSRLQGPGPGRPGVTRTDVYHY